MRKVTLRLLMGTPRAGSAPATLTALCAALVAVSACSAPGSSGNGTHSPTPLAAASPSASSQASPASPSAGASPSTATSPSPSPPPALTGSYGVLAGPFNGATYSVTLVGVDGKVVASAQASTSPSPTCAGQAAGVVPYPVSTSNSRAYFMDAQGVVRFLGPNGDTGRATTVPASTGSRRSTFSVSPDDQRIAVVVIDFTSGGASTRLYVEDLNGGGNHLDTFSETGSYTLWPVGWHGGNLVVAKVPSCTQGGGPTCCGPQEFHVVDPSTAARRFTVGGSTCVIAGPASPAGAVCETGAKANVLSWTGTVVNSLTFQGYAPALPSPDGHLVALVDYTSSSTRLYPTNAAANLTACGWIDDNDLLQGGVAQQQARVGNITNGKVVPVAAIGDCAGRLPGGL